MKNFNGTKKIFFVLMCVTLFVAVHASVQGALPVNASADNAANTSITLPNPLGVTNITDLIGKIIDLLIVFALPVVIVMIVWAAYLFMTSAGDPAKLTTARNALLWTVVGYAILLIAKGIGLIIQNFFM